MFLGQAFSRGEVRLVMQCYNEQDSRTEESCGTSIVQGYLVIPSASCMKEEGGRILNVVDDWKQTAPMYIVSDLPPGLFSLLSSLFFFCYPLYIEYSHND
jgi:hypothetical protein